MSIERGRAIKVLELFSGSKTFSKEAEKRGHEVFTVDIEYGPDYCVDILEINLSKIPFKPDVIWASPPCTTFSVASIGTHWGGGHRVYLPKTDAAKKGIDIASKTIAIILELQPKFWFIENPRGVLRKLNPYKHLKPREISYCKYGDDRMKPTDIWTNCKSWISRPMCKNGNNDCHVAAPRGAKTGTQGLKGAYERSKLPIELCNEILDSIERGRNE